MVINRVNKMTIKPSKTEISNNKLKVSAPRKLLGNLSTTSILGPSAGVSSSNLAGNRSSANANIDKTRLSGVGGGGEVSLSVPDGGGSKNHNQLMTVFIVFFAIYLVVCIVYIIGTAGLWGWILCQSMEYFIRDPNTASFTEIQTGTSWMVFKFLLGSVIHVILLSFTMGLLKGCKLWRKIMIKYEEKLFLWIGIVAVISLVLMGDATLDYIISRPTVLNGSYRDTLLPPADGNAICFPSGTEFRADKDDDRGVEFIQVNLKWFLEVLCDEESSGRGPRWKEFLSGSKPSSDMDTNTTESKDHCEHFLGSKANGAKSDCKKAFSLYLMVLLWMIADLFGIFFCWALFYLHRRLKISKKQSLEGIIINYQFTSQTARLAEKVYAFEKEVEDEWAQVTGKMKQLTGRNTNAKHTHFPPAATSSSEALNSEMQLTEEVTAN